MVRQSDCGRKLQDQNCKGKWGPARQAEIGVLLEPGNCKFLSKDSNNDENV